MARQILINKPGTIKLQSSRQTAPMVSSSGRQLSVEQLRRRRSSSYVDALRKLDTGGPVSATGINAIRDAVAAEFPDGPASWPLGWVSKCYLGAPYEVHIVDISGHIIRHFKRGEAMPGGMERARSLAASGRYAVIEVFSDRLVAIADDGTTSVSMG
ncbi:hypothetical protein [Acetobacter tropicalis]|nr:hypothetical protein [Acetobacter tropicalis]